MDLSDSGFSGTPDEAQQTVRENHTVIDNGSGMVSEFVSSDIRVDSPLNPPSAQHLIYRQGLSGADNLATLKTFVVECEPTMASLSNFDSWQINLNGNPDIFAKLPHLHSVLYDELEIARKRRIEESDAELIVSKISR